MKPFVPNEQETRLIRLGVNPERISYCREFCKAHDLNYNGFLDANEKLLMMIVDKERKS